MVPWDHRPSRPSTRPQPPSAPHRVDRGAAGRRPATAAAAGGAGLRAGVDERVRVHRRAGRRRLPRRRAGSGGLGGADPDGPVSLGLALPRRVRRSDAPGASPRRGVGRPGRSHRRGGPLRRRRSAPGRRLRARGGGDHRVHHVPPHALGPAAAAVHHDPGADERQRRTWDPRLLWRAPRSAARGRAAGLQRHDGGLRGRGSALARRRGRAAADPQWGGLPRHPRPAAGADPRHG